MFRFFIFLFSFYSFHTLFSQNNFNENGEKEGSWVGYHENGNIKYKGQFVKDKEVGIFNYYDYSGNLLIKLNYIDPGTMSQVEIYDANGVIKSTGYYLNKEKHGVWVSYNIKKEKISQEQYRKGLLNGDCIYYYNNGVVSETYYYIDGFREGAAEMFYRSGHLNMQGNYYKDKLHGQVIFYYDDHNKIESKGQYVMGLKDSLWIFLNQIGDTLDVIDY